MADTKARWAGACVVLHDGKRLGWKVERGGMPGDQLNHRYFAGYQPRECQVLTRRFADPRAFEKAERWAARFPPHPREGGWRPGIGLTHVKRSATRRP